MGDVLGLRRIVFTIDISALFDSPGDYTFKSTTEHCIIMLKDGGWNIRKGFTLFASINTSPLS
jgi:hypothetical protein